MSLSIAITCYPTFGGSGIIATEIGLAMAGRGHRVHFICADLPHRLDCAVDNIFFHQVRALEYAVFPQVPYAVALASAMVSVATHKGIDVLHSHYAVPHATSAWMAREVLGTGPSAPRLVTTLHGTDITLVGADPSYLPITRHSIVHSDAITTPSEYLRRETQRRLDIDASETPIEVIPNFVDTAAYRPLEGTARPRLAALFGPDAATTPAIVHISNFRPVKQVDRVVEVFARVAERQPAFLVLVGDGPERHRVEDLVRRKGLSDRVRLLGKQEHFEALLSECQVFLLPSITESFGLAALEAMSAGVPVVASAVGGLPEVIRNGETGFLCHFDDVSSMVQRVCELLDNPDRHAAMARAARADAVARFQVAPTVQRYEALYERLLTA